MSAARARRRLMAFERYRRRGLDLRAGLPLGFASHARHRAWCRVDRQLKTRRSYPWLVREPYRWWSR